MKSKKYWYKFFIGECPICGRDKSYKERQYTPEPDNREEKVVYLPYHLTYDNCDIAYI